MHMLPAHALLLLAHTRLSSIVGVWCWMCTVLGVYGGCVGGHVGVWT